MFLILGTSTRNKKLGFSHLPETCANCHNQMQWDKIQVVPGV